MDSHVILQLSRLTERFVTEFTEFSKFLEDGTYRDEDVSSRVFTRKTALSPEIHVTTKQQSLTRLQFYRSFVINNTAVPYQNKQQSLTRYYSYTGALSLTKQQSLIRLQLCDGQNSNSQELCHRQNSSPELGYRYYSVTGALSQTKQQSLIRLQLQLCDRQNSSPLLFYSFVTDKTAVPYQFHRSFVTDNTAFHRIFVTDKTAVPYNVTVLSQTKQQSLIRYYSFTGALSQTKQLSLTRPQTKQQSLTMLQFHRNFVTDKTAFHRIFVTDKTALHRSFVIDKTAFHRSFVTDKTAFHRLLSQTKQQSLTRMEIKKSKKICNE
ncbi:hypothetical protein DPMN_031747 [Dreissena polymorpha]|uniref:Uncharacterized protein n=1 Tax=Dreissena polymorpha TaxID=45954 RepID=A0A9D4M0I6_DREPO|nr:hypothetical protein DPMN_031747 [Dreissena polymorpha]